jgi:hypothetical protein
MGQEDPSGEFLGEEGNDVGDTGSENLADTDFLGSLFCREGGQPKKAQACDQDGEGRKSREQLPDLFLSLVKTVKMIVQEKIVEGLRRRALPDSRPDLAGSGRTHLVILFFFYFERQR